MANKQMIFADRMVGASVHNGIVRLNLAVHAGTVTDKDGKTAQRMELVSQLVMPLDAFAEAVNMQQNMLRQLVERSKVVGETKTSGESQPEK